jgi:hypothetical protein
MNGDELELYKSLRTEVNVWVAQIPRLWLEKMAIVGAAIAWIRATDGHLSEWPDAQGIAWMAVPLLAIAIDLKILSYALQGRIASAFLAARFEGLTREWERADWGFEGPLRRLTVGRATACAIVTVGPTLVSLLVASFALHSLQSQVGKDDAVFQLSSLQSTPWGIAWVAVAFLYSVVAIRYGRRIFDRPLPTAVRGDG